VRLTLSAPFTPLLASLTEGPGFMSSPTAIQKGGSGYGQQPVGTGPFVMSEWLKADQIRLKKFDGYWRAGMPKVTDAVWKPIPDETVRMANLASGTVNIVDDVPAQDRDSARKNPNYNYWDATGTRWPMMRLNVAKDPFTNKAFRQAVSYAVNRDDIVRAVYFGEAEPALGPISPLYKSYFDASITQWGLGYDPDKAKAKLAESGVSGATFTIDVANNASQQRLGEIIKENLGAIGVTANIQPYESTAMQDRITNKLYQATIGSWTPRPDIDGTMYRHFASDGNVNSMSYSNPEVDKLLQQSRTQPNGPDRVQTYQQVQKLIVDDAPWVFLVFEKQGRAYLKSVSQIPQIPDMMLRLATVSVSG
jgi:peptide/nickel transport system substrate-binding protein